MNHPKLKQIEKAVKIKDSDLDELIDIFINSIKAGWTINHVLLEIRERLKCLKEKRK